MRKFGILLGAAALVALATPAAAADLYNNSGGSTKDAPAANFLPSGFYASIGLGGSLTDTKLSGASGQNFNPADFNFAGFAGDGRVGFDYQLGGGGSKDGHSNWIVGAFAGVGVDDVKGLITTQNSGNQDLSWEVGARLGYAVNSSSLIYGFGAYRGTHLAITNPGKSTNLTGVEVGGGLEIDLASLTGKKGLFIGHETGWTWYGDWTPAVGAPKISEDELTSKIRLGVRF